MADYERVTCVKQEVFVYRIPPRNSTRGYRAADWKLDDPDWTGRLRVVSKGKECILKLEDKMSGELFALCRVDAYPGPAVEQVLDSSRYFVIRISDQGRSASIGIGFADRGDSFDLLVALQDHFKLLKREETEAKEAANLNSGPKLDLGFKEGQTIKININTKKNQDDEGNEGIKKSRPRGGGNASGGGILLPPPPGGVKIAAPPRGVAAAPPVQSTPAPIAANTFQSPQPQSQSTGSSNLDLLLDFGVPSSAPVNPALTQPQSTDLWGDFAQASNAFGSSSSGPAASNTSSSSAAASGWTSFD